MAILKRIAIALAFVLSVGQGLCLADQIGLDKFGYLNNNEAPAIIDQTEAQDLLNVDVTAGGKSIKKRSGYGLYKTLSTSQALHGGIHFYDSSGNDVQVWGSSTSLWGIVADGTPTQLISSATLNSTWDCADTQGNAYCVNSSRNALIKTNGATQTWYTSPLGKLITITPLRLVVAGVSGAENTLYYSQANTFTNFTVGNAATDAYTEVIAAPGSRITNLEYACGKVLWWKDQSFGYVLGSDDQTKVQVVTVSNSVGSQDNSVAIEPNGAVHFRAQDGHFYRYNCSDLEKLSVDISPNVQTSASRTSNSWTVSSVSDFNSGSTSNATVTSAGVIISTNNVNPPGNSFETGHGWSCSPCLGGDIANASTSGTSCGSLVPINGTKQVLYQTNSSSFTTTVDLIDSASPSTVYATYSWPYAANSCSGNTGILRTMTVNGAGFRKQVKLRVTFENSSRNVITSPEFTGNGNDITFYLATDASGTQKEAVLDFFQNGRTDSTSPGIFYSAVHNQANLTAWDTFSAVKTDDNATHTFFIRSSTNSFSILSSTPSWVSATNGAVISASTGTYVQFKDSMTVTVSSQNPVFQSATLNWFEGQASDKAYATYFDNAIWWSVAYGSGQSTNNYIFRFDLLNPGWGLYNFGANGFLLQNNRLYFGSTASDGRIYRFGNASDDNGSSINAYWQSKDFPGQDPWLDNEYTQLDTVARRNANQALTVTYTLSNSSSTAYTVSLSSSTDSIIRHKKLLPTGKLGGLFSVKFSDNSSTSAWEVLGFRFMYRPLTYKPTQ